MAGTYQFGWGEEQAGSSQSPQRPIWAEFLGIAGPMGQPKQCGLPGDGFLRIASDRSVQYHNPCGDERDVQ
jgi:hypothetical protein